jgi:hypothetical protein
MAEAALSTANGAGGAVGGCELPSFTATAGHRKTGSIVGLNTDRPTD